MSSASNSCINWGAHAGNTCISSHRSAEAALEEIPRRKPDVVLMDINLPKMSGIDCVRELKGMLPSDTIHHAHRL